MLKTWLHTPQYYLFRHYTKKVFYLIGMSVTGAAIVVAAVLFIQPDLTPYPKPKLLTASSLPQTSTTLKPNILDVDEIFRLVNEKRAAEDLDKLTYDPGLTLVAETRAKDMALNRYYSHINLSGKYFYDYFKDFGFSTGFSCENLDVEFTTDETVYVKDWLTSERGHRECLLSKKVTKAGYATAVFSDPQTDGSSEKSYIVVGVHAGPPFKRYTPQNFSPVLEPSSHTNE